MRRVVLTVVLTALMLVSNHLLAQQTVEVLTNKNIVELCKLGIGNAAILAKIRSTPGNYDVTVEGMKLLKKNGISDAVIAAMIEAQSGSKTVSNPKQTTTNSGSSTGLTATQTSRSIDQNRDGGFSETPHAIRPFLVGNFANGNAGRIELGYGTLELKGNNVGSRVGNYFSSGFSGSVFEYLMPGVESDVKVPNTIKSVLLEGYDPKSMNQYGQPELCKVEVWKEKRIVGLRTNPYGAGFTLAGKFKKPVENRVKLEKMQDGSWGFTVTENLEKGHYIILFPKMPKEYWDFDVI
ncbi:hypothetical protein [Alistipes sp. ZOR0009]|uniref:hypothetical protein n=1 Tax=Alistipes sp. ZOR0009 TaxID=1339253 RepID=UPI000645AFFC|nr:hypothetical protein [Alistipes sp. ZOR0009]